MLQGSSRLGVMRKLFTLRNGFYLIGILNLIDILQTLPFFPTFEANLFVRQHPYILFTYKIVVFVIIVPLILPRLVEKYGSSPEDVVTRTIRFLSYTLVTVANLAFFYAVISNTIAIFEILRII